jgi:hypothetical protein
MAPFTGLPPCQGPNRPIFLLDVSCHRIADASRARGRLLRAREDASVDGAWVTHSRHMIHILSAVNRGISDKSHTSRSKKEALRRILTLLYFDLLVDASTWRPHLVGYLALAQHMGGVRALMRENDAYINSTQWSILVYVFFYLPWHNMCIIFRTETNMFKPPQPASPLPPTRLVRRANNSAASRHTRTRTSCFSPPSIRVRTSRARRRYSSLSRT